MSEIRVNKVINAAGADAPNFPYGFSVSTGYGITGGGNVVATAGTFSGALTAGAGTFSGAVNIDATTDSTSTTTGALIVDGGLGVAKDVYIGAGLSVAGTLTYEDATNIDSVGLITAQSGIRVPGGQLTVGVAYSVGAAGVATAAGFVGPLTGDVTGNVTGNASGSALNVTQAAQTAITSLGDLTGLEVTGDVLYDNGTNTDKDVFWDASANSMLFYDSVYAKFGTGSDAHIVHDGTNFTIKNGTGDLYLQTDNNFKIEAADGGNDIIHGIATAQVELHYNGNVKLETTNEGAKITGFTSTTAGLGVTGGMWEGAFIKTAKLSDNKTLGISTANIFVFQTTESTTSTPNIIWNDTYPLSSKMKVGDAVTVTVIHPAAAAGYSANWTIDGNAVSEQWNGGSAPSEGGSDGFDVYTLTIIRKAAGTGDTGWLVFANVNNFT